MIKNILWILAIVFLVGCSRSSRNETAEQAQKLSSKQTSNTHVNHKDVVVNAFNRWAKGESTPFDLLSSNVNWTIAGTSPVSGIYKSKAGLMENAVKPITSRLATPIVPYRIESVKSFENTVVVLWHGHATALDGKSYDNTYSWHLTFKGDSIVQVTAFLDTYVLNDLIQRVSPR